MGREPRALSWSPEEPSAARATARILAKVVIVITAVIKKMRRLSSGCFVGPRRLVSLPALMAAQDACHFQPDTAHSSLLVQWRTVAVLEQHLRPGRPGSTQLAQSDRLAACGATWQLAECVRVGSAESVAAALARQPIYVCDGAWCLLYRRNYSRDPRSIQQGE